MAEKKRANRKKRILFVKNPILSVKKATRSFVEQDVQILRRSFDVRVIDFIFSRKNPKGTLTTLFNMLKGILWADASFSWFAVSHAAFAVLLSRICGRKSLVVSGGYDVANVPKIGYGVMLSPRGRFIAKFALKHADKVLAVSEFNKNEALNYVDPDKIELVYNAVDCDRFKPQGKKNEDLVIAVGAVTHRNIKAKGLEVFIKTASYLPDIKFIHIGRAYDKSIEYLKATAPVNVEFAGYIPFAEMPVWYQKAKVYCQLSYRESFCLSLAEAMACSCVPVVTKKAALPELVGDTGFYVPYGNPEATADAIKKALKSDKGEAARQRIKRLFPIQAREKALVKIIREAIEEK